MNWKKLKKYKIKLEQEIKELRKKTVDQETNEKHKGCNCHHCKRQKIAMDQLIKTKNLLNGKKNRK